MKGKKNRRGLPKGEGIATLMCGASVDYFFSYWEYEMRIVRNCSSVCIYWTSSRITQ